MLSVSSAINPPMQGKMEFRIGARGEVRASGSLRRTATATVGAFETITVGSAQTACADSDQDGVDGVTRVTVSMRDAQGKTLVGIVRPVAGEVDEAGPHPAILELDGQRYETTLTVHLKQAAGRPLRKVAPGANAPGDRAKDERPSTSDPRRAAPKRMRAP